MQVEDRIGRIVACIKKRISKVPDLGIICGSGLGSLAETIQKATVIPYKDIPGFPRSTVEGHASEMVFGDLGGKFVVALKGRFHFYEGYTPAEVAISVRALAALGIRLLIVTNAAGGVNPDYRVGDVMVMKDHIALNGLAGVHPLVGPNDSRFGPRFPLGQSYCPNMQKTIVATAKKLELKRSLQIGTYIGVSGPSYETPAEIGVLRILGADAVGMSTVFEVIVASHCSIPVLGLSLITNRCRGPKDEFPPPTHAEVLGAVKEAEAGMQKLVATFVHDCELAVTRPPAYAAFAALVEGAATPVTQALSGGQPLVSKL